MKCKVTFKVKAEFIKTITVDVDDPREAHKVANTKIRTMKLSDPKMAYWKLDGISVAYWHETKFNGGSYFPF